MTRPQLSAYVRAVPKVTVQRARDDAKGAAAQRARAGAKTAPQSAGAAGVDAAAEAAPQGSDGRADKRRLGKAPCKRCQRWGCNGSKKSKCPALLHYCSACEEVGHYAGACPKAAAQRARGAVSGEAVASAAAGCRQCNKDSCDGSQSACIALTRICYWCKQIGHLKSVCPRKLVGVNRVLQGVAAAKPVAKGKDDAERPTVVRCKKCNQESCDGSKCPARENPCGHCKKVGHYASVCWIKLAHMERTAREGGDGAAATSPTAQTAKACRQFASANGCPRGVECKYAHIGGGLLRVVNGEDGRPEVRGKGGGPSRRGGAPVSETPRRH
jgi:hypothetical protein